jgi:hypothetical protein
MEDFLMAALKVLELLGWLDAIALALGTSGPPLEKREAPAIRYAYVSANATASDDGRRVRVKLVSAVFAYCEGRDRKSAILEASESAFIAALRRRFRSGSRAWPEISYRRFDAHQTLSQARTARRDELRDPAFGEHLVVGYTRRATACE